LVGLRVLALAELVDDPRELVLQVGVAGGRGLREHRHVMAGPVAAEQAAVLPAAGRRDAGRVRPARELVEQDQELALVVAARERDHPVLLLLEQAGSQRYLVERERLDGRRRAGADIRREDTVPTHPTGRTGTRSRECVSGLEQSSRG